MNCRPPCSLRGTSRRPTEYWSDRNTLNQRRIALLADLRRLGHAGGDISIGTFSACHPDTFGLGRLFRPAMGEAAQEEHQYRQTTTKLPTGRPSRHAYPLASSLSPSRMRSLSTAGLAALFDTLFNASFTSWTRSPDSQGPTRRRRIDDPFLHSHERSEPHRARRSCRLCP